MNFGGHRRFVLCKSYGFPYGFEEKERDKDQGEKA